MFCVRGRYLFAFAILSILGLGCSRHQDSVAGEPAAGPGVFCKLDVPEAVQDMGWQRTTYPGYGMVMNCPPGWYDGSPVSELIAIHRVDPTIRDMETRSRGEVGIRLFDSRPESVSELAFSQIEVDIVHNKGLDTRAQANKFRQEVSKAIYVGMEDHPMGKIPHFTVDLPSKDMRGRDVMIRLNHYLFVTPKVVYDFVASYPVQLEGEELPLIQQALQTFRVLTTMKPSDQPVYVIMPVSPGERAGELTPQMISSGTDVEPTRDSYQSNFDASIHGHPGQVESPSSDGAPVGTESQPDTITYGSSSDASVASGSTTDSQPPPGRPEDQASSNDQGSGNDQASAGSTG